VNTSASAVPEGFLARAKTPIISVEPPLCEMFFFRCQISCADKEQVEASKNIRAMFIS